tara:strand:- start:567 stop:902 length:336 start_codon:yes stop_codon:yes gene_type:complete
MRKATKRFKILDIYKENPQTPIQDIGALTNSSELYVKSVIADYHTQLVSYYDVHMAPSLSDDNTFYLFTSNGAEKKFQVHQKTIYSKEILTQLEKFYLQTNLGVKEFANFL